MSRVLYVSNKVNGKGKRKMWPEREETGLDIWA
jgi:hypothetical protein